MVDKVVNRFKRKYNFRHFALKHISFISVFYPVKVPLRFQVESYGSLLEIFELKYLKLNTK